MASPRSGCREYFAMAFPDTPGARGRSSASGSLVAARRRERGDPTRGASALALARSSSRARPAARPPRRPRRRACSALGLSLLGVLYVGFFIAARRARCATGERRRAGAGCSSPSSSAMGSRHRRLLRGAVRSAGTSSCPTVSPSKTVEGSIGAIARRACSAALLLQARLLPALGLGEVDRPRPRGRACLAQLGDLCESALKRAFGAKDSGLDNPRPRWHPRSAGQPRCSRSSSSTTTRGSSAVLRGPNGRSPCARNVPARVHRRARRAGLRPRARALPRRQARRREGAALLDRLRAGALLAAARRDRVRAVAPSRSAAT